MKAKILAAALAIGTMVSPLVDAAGAAESTQGTSMATGEVRKVDKEQAKLTIRHGPLANLGMPAMTMVFRVKDPAMLNQVKEGDKVSFVAEKIDGAITVTELKPGQ